jgi:hypothetical protein
MQIIEDSGVHFDGVAYDRLFRMMNDDPDYFRHHPAVIVGLTRIHVFAASA